MCCRACTSHAGIYHDADRGGCDRESPAQSFGELDRSGRGIAVTIVENLKPLPLCNLTKHWQKDCL